MIVQHLSIKKTLPALALVLLMSYPAPAETFRGAAGYRSQFLWSLNDPWTSMPEIYPHSSSEKTDIYNGTMTLQGLEGFVNLTENWQLGALFLTGGAAKTLSASDTSFKAATGLISGGLSVDYLLPIDPARAVSFGIDAGLNSYSVSYAVEADNDDWESVLDRRQTGFFSNSLSADPAFYLRLRITAHWTVLESVYLKAAAGLHYTRFAASSWSLNNLTPVSAEDQQLVPQ